MPQVPPAPSTTLFKTLLSQFAYQGTHAAKKPPTTETNTPVQAQSPRKRPPESDLLPTVISSKRPRTDTSPTYPLPPLPDHLLPSLTILFTGINPGLTSSTTGHHYAGPNNHFWPSLVSSGLTNGITLTSKEDHTCPDLFNFGFTNIVGRPTKGVESIRKEEWRKGAMHLRKKLERCKPKVVCFVGVVVWRAFTGVKGKIVLGLQEERVRYEDGGETLLYVVPSTSGRVSKYRREDYVRLFVGLKEVVEGLVRDE